MYAGGVCIGGKGGSLRQGACNHVHKHKQAQADKLSMCTSASRRRWTAWWGRVQARGSIMQLDIMSLMETIHSTGYECLQQAEEWGTGLQWQLPSAACARSPGQDGTPECLSECLELLQALVCRATVC